MRPRTSVSKTLPAPTRGWNARDPVDQMEEGFALSMINYFPGFADIELRKGFAVHATGMGSGAVQTLAEFVGQDGTRKLISAANGNIYNATTAGAATSLASGFTSNKWQTVNFRNRLILVNGVDTPKQYDGSTVTTATYTGVSSPNELINVHSYKTRLYFLEEGTQNLWYGGVNAITGALTSFDVGGFLKLGGYPIFAGSVSRDTRSGEADYFVLVTNVGEALIYSGSYPGGSDWVLAGRYYLPAPLGRRSFFNLLSDLLIITEQGVVSFNDIIRRGEYVAASGEFTNNISNAFREVASMYGSNFGWEGVVFPAGNMTLFNIPIAEGTTSEQYVINNLTGSWARFTGMNSSTWGLYDKNLYFGGMDGKIYRAQYGTNDNEANIPTQLKLAFDYFGDRAAIKRFLNARPLIRSDASLEFNFGCDVDFRSATLTTTASTEGSDGSMWDTSPWDTSPWDSNDIYSSNWYALNGIGRAMALKMNGNFKNVSFNISAINILFQPGGVL